MNFTLNQLRIFLKIAQTESITKAAEALHLTQPAVSIQLKNFQQQFDIPLTEVVSKRLFITDFGREIARAAENILNEVHAIDYRTQAFRGQLSGRLKVSVVSTGKYVIPYFLSSFLRKHPEVELQLDVTNKARVVESLEKNEVDFALVSVQPEHLRLQHIALMQNKLYLVGNMEPVPEEHHGAASILESLPLIYREQGSATRQAMEGFIEENRLRVRKKLVLSSNEAVKQAVLAGLGYSIMPLIGIRQELHLGLLRILPVEGLPLSTTWNLVWLDDKRPSPVAAAYEAHLLQEKEEIIRRHFD